MSGFLEHVGEFLPSAEIPQHAFYAKGKKQEWTFLS